jgi:hypothetical protein
MAGYRPDTQVVLRAMQHYGLILADNGSNWYFQGEAINNWDDGFISDLKRVPASAFDAVDESSLIVDPNSGQYRAAPPQPTAPASTPTKAPPAVAAKKGVVNPATSVAPTTTVPPSTTTSVLGPLPLPEEGTSPKSGDVALATPHPGSGGRGWAPWVAGGLLLGAGGTVFWRWRRA